MRAASENFPFVFEPRYVAPARVFGVDAARAWVRIEDATLTAHFGPWRVSTPLSNIAAVGLTGPYAFLKTAGPARLGVTDRGLTFATNSRRGVCLDLHRPITGIDPWGLIRHPNLTLTVADCTALAETLRDAS